MVRTHGMIGPDDPQDTVLETVGPAVDWPLLWKAFRSHPKTLLIPPLVFALLSGFLSAWFWPEQYESVGTLIFNTGEIRLASPDSDTGSSSDPLLGETSPDANPYKSQEELLKSQLIRDRVRQKLQQDGTEPAEPMTGKKPPKTRYADLPEKALRASQVKGTNLIRLSAVANSPTLAQEIANAYLSSYLDLTGELSSASLQQNKRLLFAQTADARRDVEASDEALKDFQKRYGFVNITAENQNRVAEMIGLDGRAHAAEADWAQKRSEASHLRAALHAKNKPVSLLVQDVGREQHKSSSSASTAADADKHSIVNVSLIQHNVNNTANDSLRADLVGRLAMAESDAVAFQRKWNVLRSQVQTLQVSLKDLPRRELDYARLQFDKKSREEHLSLLQRNVSELNIQEAALRQKALVIDKPNLPDGPITWPRWLIILLATVSGLLLSLLIIVMQTLLGKKSLTPSRVERLLGAPVLAVLPDTHHAAGHHASDVAVSGLNYELVRTYQDFALNMKVHRDTCQENAFVLSGLNSNTEHSVVLANLALYLAQSGERILLIDANLRAPRLHHLFGHTLDYENGLIELINSISECLFRKKEVYADDILPLIQQVAIPSDAYPQLDYINAGLVMEHTFEFLNSKGFSTLMRTAKLGYDWVFIDSPPFLQEPDGAILLSYADGLLLFVENDTTQTQLMALKRKIAKLHASIPGVVLKQEAE